MLSGKKGIVTKVTKESHACKFTIDWDTGGTSMESARGILKRVRLHTKKQKLSSVSPLFVESEERPGSDSVVIRMMMVPYSETEEEREDSVQREDYKTWKDIGMLMAENE